MLLFFFFKRKTAFGSEDGLVGSEMWIRARYNTYYIRQGGGGADHLTAAIPLPRVRLKPEDNIFLLYTFAPADEEDFLKYAGRLFI